MVSIEVMLFPQNGCVLFEEFADELRRVFLRVYVTNSYRFAEKLYTFLFC